jgi:hypothetical protein
MYRDGATDAELIAGQERMQKEQKWFAETFDCTRFIYQLQSEKHREAGRLGLEAFKQNAALVLVFCPEIESVELVVNGIKSLTWRCHPSEPVLIKGVNSGISRTRCDVTSSEEGQQSVWFLHTSIEEPDAELSRKYNCPRELRLTLAVQVDSHNNVVKPPDCQTSCFCVFPLIGFEDFVLPAYVNSPDFEPNAERVLLELGGSFERDGVITDVGVNYKILERSIPLFENLVEYLAKDYHKLYILARGLQKNPSGLTSFDDSLFSPRVMNPYRNVLLKFPIVESVHRRIKLKDALFVTPDDRTLYGIYGDFFGIDSLAKDDDNGEWAKALWPTCGVVKTVDYLCEFIQKFRDFESLRLREQCDKDVWLTRLYDFLYTQKREALLKTYAIVPNAHNRWIKLTPEVFKGETLSDHALDCLNAFPQPWGIDWRANMVRREITVLRVPAKTQSDITKAIRKAANGIIKASKDFVADIGFLWPLLRIIPKDLPESFQKKRTAIQRFAKDFNPSLSAPQDGNGFLQECWDEVDNFVIGTLIKSVASCKSLNNLHIVVKHLRSHSDQVNWLNHFLAFLQEHAPEIWNSSPYGIIPDQTGRFHFA